MSKNPNADGHGNRHAEAGASRGERHSHREPFGNVMDRQRRQQQGGARRVSCVGAHRMSTLDEAKVHVGKHEVESSETRRAEGQTSGDFGDATEPEGGHQQAEHRGREASLPR